MKVSLALSSLLAMHTVARGPVLRFPKINSEQVDGILPRPTAATPSRNITPQAGVKPLVAEVSPSVIHPSDIVGGLVTIIGPVPTDADSTSFVSLGSVTNTRDPFFIGGTTIFGPIPDPPSSSQVQLSTFSTPAAPTISPGSFVPQSDLSKDANVASTAKASSGSGPTIPFAPAASITDATAGTSTTDSVSIGSTASPTSTVAAPPPQLVLSVGSYKYYGCFTEGAGVRAINDAFFANDNTTVESCVAACSEYRFAGIEYSRECWCGSDFNSGSGRVSDSQCSMACGGDPSEICGGSTRLSVYRRESDNFVSPSSGGSSTASGTASSQTTLSSKPSSDSESASGSPTPVSSPQVPLTINPVATTSKASLSSKLVSSTLEPQFPPGESSISSVRVGSSQAVTPLTPPTATTSFSSLASTASGPFSSENSAISELTSITNEAQETGYSTSISSAVSARESTWTGSDIPSFPWLTHHSQPYSNTTSYSRSTPTSSFVSSSNTLTQRLPKSTTAIFTTQTSLNTATNTPVVTTSVSSGCGRGDSSNAAFLFLALGLSVLI